MNVYPSHRSAAAPQRIYDATKRIATTAQLAKGGNGVTNAGEGIPFAIPKEGIEVFWNHVLRYRGDVIVRQIGQAPVTASGAFTMVKFHDETMVAYSLPGAKSENLDNIIAYFIQETVAPARYVGEVLLVHETLDQSKDNRKAWVYNPGQRRVRRAPNVAFDNPGTNSDNLIVGRVLGATPLGYYGLAYRLMLLPIQRLGDIIGVAVFPAFARAQDVTIAEATAGDDAPEILQRDATREDVSHVDVDRAETRAGQR
jgi:hypothetical protein